MNPVTQVEALASAAPDDIALVSREQTLTRADLKDRMQATAALLGARGARPGTWVVVALPTSVEHVLTVLGAWACGASVLPLNPRLPTAERDAVLASLGGKQLIVDDAELVRAAPPASWDGVTEHPGPWRATASGGSTGVPKIIVDRSSWQFSEPRDPTDDALGLSWGQVQLVAGPSYHNTPFWWSHQGLLRGHRLVLMERFDAQRFLDLVGQHRVQLAAVVPTMMARVARLAGVADADLSSLQVLFHTGGMCAEWVKQAWIDLLGPERVIEGYGSSEDLGMTLIRGDEWLVHRGSVGRPFDCEIRILDADGAVLPTGEVGLVHTRKPCATGDYAYLGAPPLHDAGDGFLGVGDLGHVDEDGYLYLSDRRQDLIVSGGVNVYPAEVEAALGQHAAVHDCAVIGLPDPEWGRRVHAVVELVPTVPSPSPDELRAHCRSLIAAHKVPKSVELVAELPRNEAGKLRRSALVQERT